MKPNFTRLTVSAILIFSSFSSFAFKAGRPKTDDLLSFTHASTPESGFSFTVMVSGKSIFLNWITGQELSRSYYEVERSFTGENFSLIGISLDGFENNTKKEYAFKDNASASKSVAYYRIKRIDPDGKFSYSKIIAVNLKNRNNQITENIK